MIAERLPKNERRVNRRRILSRVLMGASRGVPGVTDWARLPWLGAATALSRFSWIGNGMRARDARGVAWPAGHTPLEGRGSGSVVDIHARYAETEMPKLIASAPRGDARCERESGVLFGCRTPTDLQRRNACLKTYRVGLGGVQLGRRLDGFSNDVATHDAK